MNKPFLICMMIILMFTLIHPLSAQDIQFTEHLIHSNTHGLGSVYAGDLDGDGDLDVLGASLEDNEYVWWRNNGGEPLAWTKFTIGGNQQSAHSIHANDFDGDGDLDLVGASYGSPQVAIWLNGGGAPLSWTKQALSTTFLDGHEVYSCDLDRDGDIDILGAASGANRISWWRNDGGQPLVWREQVIDNNFNMPKSVHAGDIDGDGDLDVVGAAIVGNDVTWWRNDSGNPIQWTELFIDPNFVGAHRVQAIDLDGDGDLDVLGAAYTGHEIAWWRNNGGSPLQWQKQTLGTGLTNACVAYACDLDDDGDKDVLGTAQGLGDIFWWRNDGSSWQRFTITNNFYRVWPLHACDLDNDGDLDIIAGSSHQGNNQVKWWENQLYKFSFSGDPVSGNLPLTVQFTDQSLATPPINSWQWDFNNDGKIDADEQHPTWTYNEAGVYSVRLVVSNGYLTRTILNENYIQVFYGHSALSFNGDNSYALCPASASLNLTDQFTFEAWIKPAGWGKSPNLGYGRIIDKQFFSWYLIGASNTYHDHSLMLQLMHSDGSISFSTSPENSLVLDTWQHVAVTYDGHSSAVNMYINGVEQAITQRTPPMGLLFDHAAFDLVLGNDAAHQLTFQGAIDEVRLWNIVRSGNDIAASMNNYLYGDEAGLVVYWQLNEADGDQFFDLSANNNDGTASHTNWVQGVALNPTAVVESAAVDGTSKNFQLFKNFPNPFNSNTTISFKLMEKASIHLTVYDISGRLVKELLHEVKAPGLHHADWDGSDNHGRIVSAGVYFFQLRTDNTREIGKMLLLK